MHLAYFDEGLRLWIKSFLLMHLVACRHQASPSTTKSEILIRHKVYDRSLCTYHRISIGASLPSGHSWRHIWHVYSLGVDLSLKGDRIALQSLAWRSRKKKWCSTMDVNSISWSIVSGKHSQALSLAPLSELFVTSSTHCCPDRKQTAEEGFIWLMINRLVTFP